MAETYTTPPVQVDNVKTLLEHAARMVDPITPAGGCYEGKPIVVVPRDFKLEALPWADAKPNKVAEVVRFHGLESFSRYVSDWKDAAGNGATVIFSGTGARRALVAVLDYHRKAADASPIPSFNRHVAVYAPRFSPRLETWRAANKKPLSQWEFAQFIENNLRDIREPAGATLLGIINEWSVEGVVKFSKVQRLQDGTVSVSFANEQTATARQMPVPTVFSLCLPVFANEAPVIVLARLRYRLGSSGELKFWFDIDELEEAAEAAWDSILAKAKTGTGIAPLLGIPDSVHVG